MASTRAVVLLALLALTAVASARSLQTTRPSQPRRNERSPKGPVMLGKPTPMEKPMKPMKPNVTEPTFIKPTLTKPNVTKPTITKPTLVKPTFDKPTMTKYNATVMFNLLNKTEQVCLDKIFNWTSIKTLKPFEQCGGAAANCTAFGKESTHCLDAEFYDWICPTNYTCARQNSFFHQCLRMNVTAMAMEKATRKDMNMNMSMNSSEPVIITGFNKTIEWEKLPQKEQVEVSKCLGWPIPPIKKLKSFEMCGGMATQLCGNYGKAAAVCKDEKFPGWECPMGEECVRQSMWYWQCMPKLA